MKHKKGDPPSPELIALWEEFLTPFPDSPLSTDHMAIIERELTSMPTTEVGHPRLFPSRAPAIPGYTVERKLGSGGMGDVWLVHDPLGRPRALKIAHAGAISKAVRERLLKEARAMDQLVHPNVARIDHVGQHGNELYLVMPVYAGSLRDRMAKYHGKPRDAVRLLAAIADGVGHLHDHGLVHRDLKPGNVLIDDDGQPAVADFGLVKPAGELDDTAQATPDGAADTHPSGLHDSLTATGAVMGTRTYMAPEQGLRDGRAPRATWDVWSLGIMLRELVTGESPAMTPPAAGQPLDPGLETVYRGCTAIDETKRYPNAAAVAAALRAWLRDPVVTTPERGRPRKGFLSMAAAAVLLVVSLGAVGFMVSRKETPEQRHQRAGERLLQRLEKGEEVTLIGKDGRPTYQVIRPLADDAYGRNWPSDGAFTLTSTNESMIELLPRSGRGIELTGYVRLNAATGGWGNAGFYAGYKQYETDFGRAHAIATVYVRNTVEGFGLPNPPQFAKSKRVGHATRHVYVLGVVREGSRFLGQDMMFGPEDHFDNPYPPDNGDEAYHHIHMVLDENGFWSSFDGRDGDTVSLDTVRRSMTTRERPGIDQPPMELPLEVGGGVGLWVWGGSASFRDVKVRYLQAK